MKFSKFKGIQFHNTHPAAYVDEQEMNRLILQHSEYVEGAQITGHNWDNQTGSVQFFYSIPEGLPSDKEARLEAAIRQIISQFSKVR